VILVTGGAGFIGSHTCAALAACGERFVIVDNFSNSRRSVLQRLKRITGSPITCIEGDVRDAALLARVLREHAVTAVIHFAGLKAVGESVREPLSYYDCNVGGTLSLLTAMRQASIRTIVFSSSATVYGDPITSPIKENFALQPANPYGWSKCMAEQLLADVNTSEPGQWRIARLRYFNPVGAHESGLIGEDPQDVPNNLMPYIAQVAVGQRPELSIFGGDYPTPDGTGVRDYIHVTDLAEGHIAALRYLQGNPGLITVNLGTGQPVSVLQMVHAFERASGKQVPYRITARRPGDVPAYWADPSLAEQLFNWCATRGVEQMCADVWRWQQNAIHLAL